MSATAQVVNVGLPAPAATLRADVRVAGDRLLFDYDVDGLFKGTITTTYPFSIGDAGQGLISAAGLGLAVFVGQLCLAGRIELSFGVSDIAIARIRPLAEMLYDVRCWKDRRDLLPIPDIDAPRGPHLGPETLPLASRRACLLWSGGKDSTLSSILLRRNGLEVVPLHITANAGVEALESEAVAHLGASLSLPYSKLRFEFPQYIALSSAYAVTWNSYPYHNTVAFGRDMALALLAAFALREHRAGLLSIGHEHDCKTAYLTYQGKRVPRSDVESTEGALALERYLRSTMLTDARLLPPLTGLYEFGVLREMLTKHADLFRSASFCFWRRNCGRCSKCLRYELAQRVLGLDVLTFETSPLEGDNCPELRDYVEAWEDESALFRNQVLYCLGRIAQRGDVRPGEDLVFRFRDVVLPHIEGELDAWERDLLATYSDPQVPDWFIYG